MTDLAIEQINGGYDLVLFAGELLIDDSLRPAIAASLLTDREYPEAPDGDRRGSWQDSLLEAPSDREGSLLWRITRQRKRTPQVLAEARQYVDQALEWLLQDGIASRIETRPSWDTRGHLQLDVAVHRPTGVQRFRLAEVWQQSLDTGVIEQARQAEADLGGIVADIEFLYYVAYPDAMT